jgi:hypothetical protein
MTTPGTHKQITTLLSKNNLTVKEKNNLFALTSRLADIDSDMSQDDYMIMYLSGKRDWKPDYMRVFTRIPTLVEPTEKAK